MGTEAIQGMAINLMKVNDMSVDENVFCNLQNLRLLQLNHVKLGGGCEYLLRKLTWLCWHGFPLSSIPDGLYGENLVAIDMRYSNLRQVKNSKNLKDLSLCGCKGSTSTTLASRLRSWFLPPSPTNLLPPSFHGLDKLTTLSLRDCNLSDDALPRDLGSLRSLTNLELGRNSFRSLPASLSNLLRLTGFELHIIGKIARHIISFTYAFAVYC
ncbi:TMV RESISTANCE PROTEIN N-LIKE [Salix purpurea]|uniref:TMV RESISTANCE PROTEIN N-LIKE n=1 Tax=Salix purpurea TaxID=77065 RepID=A0A9Q0V966_SALPP|nr:TMV RESISTANCE PROTEIN N-LIKE [Salix purpurea]